LGRGRIHLEANVERIIPHASVKCRKPISSRRPPSRGDVSAVTFLLAPEPSSSTDPTAGHSVTPSFDSASDPDPRKHEGPDLAAGPSVTSRLQQA
jgi:hypothetical protein